jgi:hypothetical protein
MASKQAIPVDLFAGGLPYVGAGGGAVAPVNAADYVHVVQANDHGGWDSRVTTLADLLGLTVVRRLLTVQVLGTPAAANEVLALYPAADAFNLPANLAGSVASVLVNPAAPFVLTISRQVAGAGAFAAIGTVSIAVDGTVTRATTGGVAVPIAAGDIIKVTSDADGDAAFVGAVTIVGQE